MCTDVQTEPVESTGENNRAHPLGNFPPTVAPATPVTSLKGVSSRWMRQEIPDLARQYHRATTP